MLNHLVLKYVGPARDMGLDFAPRLNILTGDNGLGKTFILDVAWWALTRTWATHPAWPHPGKAKEAQITYSYEGRSEYTSERTASFDPQAEEWTGPPGRPGMAGLVLYVRVDGGFSVWDPARNYWKKLESRGYDDPERPKAFNFSPSEVWNGIQKDGNQWICNGLLRDWVAWQDRGSNEFEILRTVLKGLSAGENEVLKPGGHTRVSVNDSRDIPTIEMPYGTIPVTLASAGMRRILALAYLVVWAHTEHQTAAKLIGDPPTDRFTILVDEVEAHLHPQWQRTILPSLKKVVGKLGTEGAICRQGNLYPNIQTIASTHAPLVLASIEPTFDPKLDKLFNFDFDDKSVRVEEFNWRRLGDAAAWLTSTDIFKLQTGRSIEAERAIEDASQLMKSEVVDAEQIRSIHKKLQGLLGETDPFWTRWCYVAEKKGGLDDSCATAE